jgi:gamma-glutamylcyclotransferase (GGCT)/AIG2-like uncharacterized protein YtfP
MAQRCPKAICLGYATLPGYEFRFATHGDILPNPDSTADGVLWEITPDCLLSLDALEGYPTYYERDIVVVEINGVQELAMTYYMVGDNRDALPSQGYLDMLREGYTEHGVPQHQINAALEFIHRYCLVGETQWAD